MATAIILSDFRARERKSVTASTFSPSVHHESDGSRCHGLSFVLFLILSFKLVFSLSSSILTKRLFRSSLLSAIRMVSSTYLRLLVFLPAILIPACSGIQLGIPPGVLCARHCMALPYSFLNFEPVRRSI